MQLKCNILVTGGSGLVGKSLEGLIRNINTNDSYIFVNSKDCDLRDELSTNMLFEKFKPDIIIHLAAKVGGLYNNMDNNYNMLIDNLKINTNILEQCRKHNVQRLINILSTCVFPDKGVTYPLTSDQILNGEPHHSNYGYSYSKRVLYIGSKILSDTSNIKVINLMPSNLYGFEDNYNLDQAHVLPSLLNKIYLAKEKDKPLIVKGRGKATRQFVYADDLSRIIFHFVHADLPEKFNSLIVGPPIEDEISIKTLVNKLVNNFDFKGEVIYDTDYSEGQIKKTVSSDELLAYIPNFRFTPLDKGLKETIEYFVENYDNLRK